VAQGRVVAVDDRTVLNPVAYWLDRPEGTLRPAAAEFARRIMRAAGLDEVAAARFLAA
jgi:hypothetical protein